MLCTVASLADTMTPLSPAIDGPGPLRTLTSASCATRGEIMVTPAPVSIAKVNGPAEFIQVSMSNPRPRTSRNVTACGSEIVGDVLVAGLGLLCCGLEGERAA